MATVELEAAQIILTAISPYVVGVFAKRYARQPSWDYATGVPVEFDGLKFILTAAHVLSHRPVDIVFVPQPLAGFLISDSVNSVLPLKSERWNIVQCVGNQDTDLGAILFEEPPQIRFFRLPRDSATPRAGSQVVICGYPIAKSKAVEIGNEVLDLAMPDVQCASVLNPDSLPALKPHQFAIDYPSMPGIVGPAGYSGSMVWYDTAGLRTLPDLRESLSIAGAGIVTDHYVSEQALFCTNIETVVDFVEREVLPVAEELRISSAAE
jgi:hypothetical protein